MNSLDQVPLRICLDARLISGTSGGTEQATIGLAYGLSQLTDGDEEYYFLSYKGRDQWIRPYLRGGCRTLRAEIQPRTRLLWFLQKRAPRLIPILRAAARQTQPTDSASRANLRPSDGTIERALVDVMHFTTQSGFLTRVPTIYQPWDLQHVHLPHFFPERVRASRETSYRSLCERASLVVVATHWGKKDLLQHYHLQEDKVAVVPIGPAVAAYPAPSEADVAHARLRLGLPNDFLYYPAQTWPHKNHLNLLEALALVRDRWHVTVPLVCSGHKNGFYPVLKRRIQQLHLADQVQFVGFVNSLEVRCLYKLARAMVFPSKFEGGGLPVVEAFLAGIPVACSNIGPLQEQAGDAAVTFDPDSPVEIAGAIHRLWVDRSLRQNLTERGKSNLARFSWERTAKMFRAHYRRLSGRRLSAEDSDILSSGTSAYDGATVEATRYA